MTERFEASSFDLAERKRKLIWGYGAIFSGMFMLWALANVALSILDANYEDFARPVIIGTYGAIHYFLNGSFRAGKHWGRIGLIALYFLWVVVCVLNFVYWTNNSGSFSAAILFGLTSLGALVLLLSSDMKLALSKRA